MPSADRIKTAHSAHHGPNIEYHSPGCAATGAQVTVNDVRHLSPSVHQPVPQVRRQKCRPHNNALQLVRPEPRELQRARAFDARIGLRARQQQASGQRSSVQIQPDLVVRGASVREEVFHHTGQRAGLHGLAQFFLQFSDQGLCRSLPRIDATAGQRPESVAHHPVQQHAAFALDQRRCALAHAKRSGMRRGVQDSAPDWFFTAIFCPSISSQNGL